MPFSYNLRTASTRVRCYYIVKELRRLGLAVELLDPNALPRYRGVVISKRCESDALSVAEKIKKQGGVLVYDICDNYFYNPYGLPDRERIKANVVRLLQLADRVTVSTEALREAVEEATGHIGRVTVVPDVVEPQIEVASTQFALSRIGCLVTGEPLRRWWLRQRTRDCTRLVWYGTAGVSYAEAGMSDLARIADVLEDVQRVHPLSLTVISNSYRTYRRCVSSLPVKTHYFRWEPASFPDLFRLHDICIIPIGQNPFTRCKSNNRLALSLLLGVPVVADGIPSYHEFVECTYLNDWRGGLLAYIEKPEVRKEHVARGRQRVERHYNARSVSLQWLRVLEQAGLAHDTCSTQSLDTALSPQRGVSA